MKQLFCSFWLFFLSGSGYSNDKDSILKNVASEEEIEELACLFARLDSIEKTLLYERGDIKLQNGNARLNVPRGFKFINARQSQYILEEVWQNLPDASVLGMIVSDSFRINSLPMPGCLLSPMKVWAT